MRRILAHLAYRWPEYVLAALAVVVVLGLAGCSPSRIIAERAVSITDMGRQVETLGRSIAAAGEDVSRAVPGVRDRTPLIVPILTALAVIVGGSVLAYLFGPLVRKVTGYIPERKRSVAKLLDEGLGDPSKMQAAVSALRTADPAIDAAFRKRREAGR